MCAFVFKNDMSVQSGASSSNEIQEKFEGCHNLRNDLQCNVNQIFLCNNRSVFANLSSNDELIKMLNFNNVLVLLYFSFASVCSS